MGCRGLLTRNIQTFPCTSGAAQWEASREASQVRSRPRLRSFAHRKFPAEKLEKGSGQSRQPVVGCRGRRKLTSHSHLRLGIWFFGSWSFRLRNKKCPIHI